MISCFPSFLKFQASFCYHFHPVWRISLYHSLIVSLLIKNVISFLSLFPLYSWRIFCWSWNSVVVFFFFSVLYGLQILVPQQGAEPIPSTVKAWSLNHWTTREFPDMTILFSHHLKNVSLPSSVYNFWWEIRHHLNQCYSADNAFFFLFSFFQDFFSLSLVFRSYLWCVLVWIFFSFLIWVSLSFLNL